MPSLRPRGYSCGVDSGSRIVVLSINSDDQSRCVDIFRRADGGYGFEEFRRDPEDPRGWFPIGGYARLVFAGKDAARDEAAARIDWFAEK